MERKTLYVGMDDSNHAGRSHGEVIVAVFSFDHSDSLVKKFGNTRNPSYSERWLQMEGRDMRYTILPHEKASGQAYNLPMVAPFLINHYLSSLAETPEDIKIYLDGCLNGRHRDIVRADFEDKFNGVLVENFIKKSMSANGKRVKKGYRCPRVVYIADNLANMKLQEITSLQRVMTDPKNVSIPLEELAARMLIFAS